MSERDKLAPSSSASPSGSPSSPDALDSASVRELSAALHGLTNRIEDLQHAVHRSGIRDQETIAAINRLSSANRELAASVDRAVRLTREVARSGQQAMASVAEQMEDVTGEFKTHAEIIKQGASMKEQAKALHFWLLLVSIVLGVVGESGVIREVHWQKLCVGLAMALGGLAVKYAASWQSSDVKAQLGDGGGK
jgi:hypothetical protein